MQLTPLVITVLVSPALAGQVRVVGPTPAPYSRIQDAITDASDGDVILVKAGSYSSLRIENKTLSIVAENGALVQESGGARIIGLGAKRNVVLSGINAQGAFEAEIPQVRNGLYAAACMGQIFAQECAFTGHVGGGPSCSSVSAPAGVELNSCNAVSLTSCNLRGGRYDFLNGAWPTLAGVIRQGSGIVVSSNTTLSCDSVTSLGETGGAKCTISDDTPSGGHGMSVGAATVFFSACTLTGGRGVDLLPPCLPSYAFAGNGGHGLAVTTPTGFAIRDLSSTFTGGQPGLNVTSPCPPGFGPYQGMPGQPVFGAGSGMAWLSGTPRVLVGPRLVRDTTPAALIFRGVSGERVELAVTIRGLTHFFDAAQFGVQHIAEPRWRTAGTVPASGQLTVNFKLPPLSPADPGATYFAQARFTDLTTGQSRLSNAWAIVEVDSTY